VSFECFSGDIPRWHSSCTASNYWDPTSSAELWPFFWWTPHSCDPRDYKPVAWLAESLLVQPPRTLRVYSSSSLPTNASGRLDADNEKHPPTISLEKNALSSVSSQAPATLHSLSKADNVVGLWKPNACRGTPLRTAQRLKCHLP
jgi:hypothetical protein